MIGKGPDWSHSLLLIKIFPDVIYRELRSNRFRKSVAFSVHIVVIVTEYTKYALRVANPREADRLAGGRSPKGLIVMSP
jgi:hypothetical protein